MTHFTSEFLGRPVSAVPGTAAHDKWALVDALTRAADSYGLGHRSIAVLRAMLTFIPERLIPAAMGRCVVYAANATLSDRLGGMPESTLRRHLAALVDAGVIARFDSPNRKRFARRLAGGAVCAFGFDVGPLALLADDIHAAAAEATRREEERLALHTAVLVARQRLMDTLPDQHADLLARTRLILRHKDNANDLADLLAEYGAAFKTSEMNATDSENERHQHRETKTLSDSDATQVETVSIELSADNLPDITAYHEYRNLFPQVATDLPALHRHASDLVPMLGIEKGVFTDATQRMGASRAALAILFILERFDDILNPGGYLRHLVKEHGLGRLRLDALVPTKRMISTV